MRSIVIHYQEIALKGANRPWFIARSVRHLRAALADLDVTEVRPLMGRVEVVLGTGASWDSFVNGSLTCSGSPTFPVRAARRRISTC